MNFFRGLVFILFVNVKVEMKSLNMLVLGMDRIDRILFVKVYIIIFFFLV